MFFGSGELGKSTKVKKLINAALLAVCATVLATFALAQGTGSEGYFEIHNNTNSNIVVGFYTNDGGGWSDNWLSDPISIGESAVARFEADTGSCEQTLRVGWLGEDDQPEVLDDPVNIDICDSTNVYLGDNEITYD
jgi:hypothetical protein